MMNRRVCSLASFRVVLLSACCLACNIVAGAQTNITDGTTPPGVAPGAPAGAYPLSDIEVLNVYNGNVNLRIPLMGIGGRGGVQHVVTLPIEQRWSVDHYQDLIFGGPTYHSPQDMWWSAPLPYRPGLLLARRVNAGCPGGPGQATHALTRITFSGPDGTEYEFRDTPTDGEKRISSCDFGGSQFNRGKVFRSTDGTSATFISDTDVYDGVYLPGFWGMSGYLLLRDGTRYRFDDGSVTWIRDRNGNKISFSYNAGSMTITDPLNRQVLVEYNVTDAAPYGLCDRISFKGNNGAARIIRISKKSLSQVLRMTQSYDHSTVKTYYWLFPQLNQSYENDFNPAGKISSVWLPDGSLPGGRQYKILYNVYGEVARVVLPTGGVTEYDWEGGEANGNLSGVTNGNEIYRRVIARRVYASEATSIPLSITTYSKYSGSNDVTVENKDASSNVLSRSKHYFYTNPLTPFGDGTPFGYAKWNDGRESQAEAIGPDWTVLRRKTDEWQQRAAVSWWTGNADLAPPNDPRIVETVSTLVDSSQMSKHTFSYSSDLHNNRTDTYEFDYGVGQTPAYPTRRTHIDYLTINSVNGISYADPATSTYSTNDVHLRSLPVRQVVYAVNPQDGMQTWAAQTEYEYDRYDASAYHAPLLTRVNITGFDSTFTTSYRPRGNVTQVDRWLDEGGGSKVRTYDQFDIAGNGVKGFDGVGNATDLDFSDRYGSPDGDARSNAGAFELVGQFSYAFPSKVTNSLGHEMFTQFDYYLGKPVDSEDPNAVKSSRYYNDDLDRPTKSIRAVGTAVQAQTNFYYDDLNRVITTSMDKDSYGESDNASNPGGIVTKVYYDGLARTVRTASYEGNTGGGNTWSIVVGEFDDMGRAKRTTNPFRASAPDAALPGTPNWTTVDYDALSRVTMVTSPDASHIDTLYSGIEVTVTDQALKKRKSRIDALGRLVEVIEDPASANYSTTYLYGALDNLVKVTQGTQKRYFMYDSLSRLIRARNPEQCANALPQECANALLNLTDPLTTNSQWSMAYSYDGNGNLTSRTDARNVVTSYLYDGVNRITQVNYNDGITPQVMRHYDKVALTNGKGRLWKSETLVSGVPTLRSEINEYDSVGRVKSYTQGFYESSQWQDYTSLAGYDLAGNRISDRYPSGRGVVPLREGCSDRL